MITQDALFERFWKQVRILPTGCWMWIGRESPGRYGRLTLRKNRTMVAHKWAYLQLRGDYDTALQLDHLCRVRRCVNPDHLEAVSARENTARSSNLCGINMRKTICKRGHALCDGNLYVNRRGTRECRKCKRMLNVGYSARRRARKAIHAT